MKNTLAAILVLSSLYFLSSCKTSANQHNTNMEEHTNHLIHEKSPYLLQHAHNPVNWYPWNEEALKKAKDENKMLIISVGYSACHWCHVMEHESFEDSAVAKLMNDHFIAIKVDREERPDIDDVYMSACQIVSRRGCGWPLNAFALADGRPVWAGTYFPKDDWINVLNHFIDLKQTDPKKLEESAEQIVQGIRNMDELNFNNESPQFSKEKMDLIVDRMLSSRDNNNGGRKGSPKFPMPINYEFLLNQFHSSGNQLILESTMLTLDKMAEGGIYDQIGGGFARYSTDEVWLAPHFEKMLYDNAQLISLYSHAYMVTKKPLYKKVIENTINFVERELKSNEGGFYSSLDADSEGEEGKYYIWTKDEIDSIISNETHRAIVYDLYGINKRGNWEHGKNILHINKSITDLSNKHNLEINQIQKIINQVNNQLFTAREEKIRPGLDDKILTAWNGLMLKAYTDAYKALGNENYKTTVLTSLDFILDNMLQSDGRLNRNYKDGESGINAFAEDYATLINALIGIYEITFNEKHLYTAQKLMDYALVHFKDEASSFFYFTSDIDPSLITRKKVMTDNVIPGSNSIMANNLLDLGILLDNEKYQSLALDMVTKMATQLEEVKQPGYYSNWYILYEKTINRPFEIAIVGKDAAKIRKEFQLSYTPNALFIGGEKEGSLKLLKDKLQEDETFIYVCLNKVCKLPVQEVGKAQLLMKN